MTAYLTLDAGSELTLSDVAGWLERARSLGADDESPVRLGGPEEVGDRVSQHALTVPVVVTLTPLPPSG